jgi:hypothetical protein
VPSAYVLDQGGTLQIFRIPEPRGSYQQYPEKTLKNVGDGYDLKVFGNALFCTRDGALEVYSLKSPEDPKPVRRFGPGKPYQGYTLICHNNTAFIIGTKAILSYDITMPLKPAFLAVCQTKGFGRNACASGSFLNADDKSRRGVSVYDISDPNRIKEVGFVPTSRDPCALFTISRDILLVSLSLDRVHDPMIREDTGVSGYSAIFSLSKPTRPALLREFASSGGESTTFITSADKSYLVCRGAVFSTDEEKLRKCFAYRCAGIKEESWPYVGFTWAGHVYHGSADGNYAALPLDQVAIVLHLKGKK